ncbi:hypothetical protein CONPUDRAFT_162844 [Coniophora puteana RWD-64-598 SS2]|uniref:Protein kinase domain-containing protein n=1 Tax=Coniophora puteana (strain RWD-64-598) TaxID=741705 RepID=A0A5M3N4D5_CONPW|nr:uncharacterized protein CONPUDRAFT_162844 [Coniophora puteana RWD-64-598 SS2]EIW85705.1 hypothetical protein CONPUDRAFT_162844 [Coniophora puteana RWD-64-598 SS2]
MLSHVLKQKSRLRRSFAPQTKNKPDDCRLSHELVEVACEQEGEDISWYLMIESRSVYPNDRPVLKRPPRKRSTTLASLLNVSQATDAPPCVYPLWDGPVEEPIVPRAHLPEDATSAVPTPLIFCDNLSSFSKIAEWRSHQDDDAISEVLSLLPSERPELHARDSMTPLLVHTPETLESELPITPRFVNVVPSPERSPKKLEVPRTPSLVKRVSKKARGMAQKLVPGSSSKRPPMNINKSLPAVPVCTLVDYYEPARPQGTTDADALQELLSTYPAFPPASKPDDGSEPHLTFRGRKFFPKCDIGYGGFAVVWAGVTDEGEEIAIKVIHKPLVVMNAGKSLDTAIKQLENEWAALQMVTEAASPFYADLLYSFEDGENI